MLTFQFPCLSSDPTAEPGRAARPRRLLGHHLLGLRRPARERLLLASPLLPRSKAPPDGGPASRMSCCATSTPPSQSWRRWFREVPARQKGKAKKSFYTKLAYSCEPPAPLSISARALTISSPPSVSSRPACARGRARPRRLGAPSSGPVQQQRVGSGEGQL
jgi:hypothetical protein